MEDKEKIKKPRSSTLSGPGDCSIILVDSGYPFSPVTLDSPSNLLMDSRGVVTFTSLPKFIERLTNGMDNLCTLPHFLPLISVISTRHEVLELLIQRFKVPPPIDPSLKREWKEQLFNPITVRVINVLKCWIQTDWESFDESLKEKFFNFLEEDEEAKKHYSFLNCAVKKKEQPFTFEDDPNDEVETDLRNRMNWEPQEIAKQITLEAFLNVFLKLQLDKILADSTELQMSEQSFPDHELNTIFEKVNNKETGIEVKDRRKVFKVYCKSFVASELVLWLEKNMGMSRDLAIGWGKHMHRIGLIENLSGRGEFEFSEIYFRIKPREDVIVTQTNEEIAQKMFLLEFSPNDSEFCSLIKNDLRKLESFVFNEMQQSKLKNESSMRQTIRKWISVACELDRLNNSHSLYGITSALYKFLQHPENGHIRDKLPDQNRQWLRATLCRFYPSRELLQKEISRPPPCIPYFPAFFGFANKVKDLKNSDGLLNLGEICKNGEILSHIKRLQQTPYTFPRKRSIVNYLSYENQ
eukprot:TRINITY_DN327_c0_g2_i2.p1 TRINITY_DN327_c0_g2~~TRINITY_DN327_c0_g2_i2.p1  ORF type:complete len:585 (-),score=129.52 TRINITY_DN327_c0_g2_i2:353-1924(-)